MNKYESHYALVKKYAGVFFLGVLGPIALVVPMFFFLEYMFLFVVVIFIIPAITTMALPFCPQEQVDYSGLKKTIHQCRLAGFFIIIMGMSMSLLIALFM